MEIFAAPKGRPFGWSGGRSATRRLSIDPDARETLPSNRCELWKATEDNVANVDGGVSAKVDVLAGAGACPPSSIADKQLCATDHRDLFPWLMARALGIGIANAFKEPRSSAKLGPRQ
jgi:hypothetical protein